VRKTALVTGGNRGIGLEICRQLAQNDIQVLMGCRSPEKMQNALEKLNSDRVDAIELDVTDPGHLRMLEDRFGGQALDILVNNAAIAEGSKYTVLTEPEEISRRTMEANFWGAWNLSRVVLRQMKSDNFGRIVNVSSGLGSFEKMGPDNPGYRLSKIALNALTVMLNQEVESHSDILINAMTPGWVRTHLGGINAERSVSEGADTAVWLCLLDRGGPRGQFFKDRLPHPW